MVSAAAAAVVSAGAAAVVSAAAAVDSAAGVVVSTALSLLHAASVDSDKTPTATKLRERERRILGGGPFKGFDSQAVKLCSDTSLAILGVEEDRW